MTETVSAYRVSNWFNIDTMRPEFGIQAKVGRKWKNVAEGHLALIFKDRADAETKRQALIAAMKAAPHTLEEADGQ